MLGPYFRETPLALLQSYQKDMPPKPASGIPNVDFPANCSSLPPGPAHFISKFTFLRVDSTRSVLIPQGLRGAGCGSILDIWVRVSKHIHQSPSRQENLWKHYLLIVPLRVVRLQAGAEMTNYEVKNSTFKTGFSGIIKVRAHFT